MSRKTRKLMWSVPLIAAVAVIGALAAFVALSPGVLFADELPGAPQNLKVAAASGNDGRTTLVLNWEAPASGAPDMYRIDVSKDNQKFTFLTEVSGTMLTHDHEVRPRGGDSMGKAGWKRYYRVYAMNSHGYGEVSSSESATTKAQAEPGEVGSVTFSSTDPTVINVNWAMPDDGGSDILGYCIRVWPTDTEPIAPATIAPLSNATCLTAFRFDGPGGSAGDYRNDDLTTANDGNNQPGNVIRTDAMKTEYMHKSLRAGQKWSYEVYAFNMHGHSETSSGVVNGTAAGPKRPTYPGSLLGLQDHSRASDGTIVAVADPLPTPADDENNIRLYWTAANDGGQDITRYEVQISDTPNHWPSEQFLTFDDANDGTVDYVPASATQSKDFAGDGPFTGQLNPDPVDTTGDQANVAVVWVSTNFGDPGPTATELGKPYQLEHTYTGSDADRDDTNARTYATKLYYRVRTVAGTGSSEMMSPWSRGKSVSVKNVVGTDSDGNQLPIFVPPVAAPMLDADANDGLANSSDTSLDSDDENGSTGGGTTTADDDLTPREIKLTISSTVAGADSYRVDTSDDDGATWTTSHEFTLPINKDDYDHRGLKPEEQLTFRFFAKDGSVLGLASNVVTDAAGNTDQPGDVRNLVAARHSTDGAGKINLSWDPPAKNGGADIEQYCIVVNLLGENDAVGANPDTRNSIFTSNYAAGADGGGTDAITANCTRLGASDAKEKNGVMTISVSGDANVYQVDHDTTMVTFTGLEQETRWQFEVFALNKASDTDVDNDGSPADDATADADEDGGRHALSGGSDKKKAGTGSATVPMAPMRLTAQLARDTDPDAIAGGIGNQGVLILWNPPKDPVGAKVLSYQIERKIDDGEFETEVATHPVGLTHWVDTDELGADETRAYRVSATNAVDTGTEMATVMIPYPDTHTHNAPVLSAIGNQTVEVDGTTTVDLSATDADGHDVTFTAMSSDESIATVTEHGDHIDIAGVAPGEATITVTATDTEGLTDTETFMVTVTAAELGDPSNVMASHTGLEATVTWDGGENADTFYVAMIRRDADGNWDIDNAVYDAAPSGSPFTVNMATRPAGTYHVFVIAGSAEAGWSNWVSGSLEYAP